MTDSRRKGAQGEREVARILRKRGYDAHRGQQFKGGPDSPDVTGLDGFHVEVKRTERFNLYDALAQSRRDSAKGETPIVVHRRNGMPWVVVMEFEDFLDEIGGGMHGA